VQDGFIPRVPGEAPPRGDGDPASPRELFQAFEVCRRLGGGLASGARYVGWHSWMAGLGTPFEGHGLREDRNDESAEAWLAIQRPSWFVYRRLATALAGTVAGQMVLPDVADRAELEEFLADHEVHHFVVFRYVGTFGGEAAAPMDDTVFRYAWLVFRDPTVQQNREWRLFARWMTPSRGGTAIRVFFLPASVVPDSTHDGLPLCEDAYPASTEVTLTASYTEITFDVWGTPILLFSDEEIEWRLLY
jgi:hypothetical protein